jgi:hypothetical protein
LRKQFSLNITGVEKETYKKLYPEWIDSTIALPKGFKVPDFTIYFRDNNKTTM